MKVYWHVIIMITIILAIFLFYKEGYGVIPFLLATIYLSVVFFRELSSEEKVFEPVRKE